MKEEAARAEEAAEEEAEAKEEAAKLAEAKAYYEACEENPYAQIALAFLYMNGQGVEKDEEKAKEMFRSVIDRGCVEGYLGTAEHAFDEEDYTTALDDFNKVLEGTEQYYIASAMNWIGYLYYSGLGVEQDYAKALEWYEKAAELGNETAKENAEYVRRLLSQ